MKLHLIKTFATMMSLTSVTSQAADSIDQGRGPSFCYSIESTLPGDPHELVSAFTVLFDHNIHRATVSFFETHVENLVEPSEIFHSEFLIESRFYSLGYEPTLKVIDLKSNEQFVAGQLTSLDNGGYTLTLDGIINETVLCN